MTDLETVRTFFASAREKRVCVGVVIKPGRSLIFAESELFALTGDKRTRVAKLSATLAVVQSR